MVNVFERLLAWFRGPKEEEKHVPCEEPEEPVAEPEEPAYAFMHEDVPCEEPEEPVAEPEEPDATTLAKAAGFLMKKEVET